MQQFNTPWHQRSFVRVDPLRISLIKNYYFGRVFNGSIGWNYTSAPMRSPCRRCLIVKYFSRESVISGLQYPAPTGAFGLFCAVWWRIWATNVTILTTTIGAIWAELWTILTAVVYLGELRSYLRIQFFGHPSVHRQSHFFHTHIHIFSNVKIDAWEIVF